MAVPTGFTGAWAVAAVRLLVSWDAVAGASSYTIKAGKVSGTYTVTRTVGVESTDGYIDVPGGGDWYVVVVADTGGASQELLVAA